MPRIAGFVVLVAMLVCAGFYIKYLQGEKKRLEAVESAYSEQIKEAIETAKINVKIAIVRDAQISKLQEEQRGFHNAIKKAQQNKAFSSWGSSPLPADVSKLLTNGSN